MKTPTQTLEDKITHELNQLLLMPRGSYLIVEHEESEFFVQFCGSDCEPLRLDVPKEQCNREQKNKLAVITGRMRLQWSESQISYLSEPITDVAHGANSAILILMRVFEILDKRARPERFKCIRDTSSQPHERQPN